MLRDYQQQAVESLLSISDKTIHPIVVAPPGAGKSHIIAHTIMHKVRDENARIVCATHRQELITQNVQKLVNIYPSAPISMYSAGLKQKKISQVTFANIQSIYRKGKDLTIDYLIIDEAHLVPMAGFGQYRKFIDALKKNNPNLQCIGLTATPWRMSGGYITEGDGIFTDICYTISIGKLVRDGWLCPLVGKKTETEVDLSNLRVRLGEFSQDQLEERFTRGGLVARSVDELLQYREERKSWLVFATSVQHAFRIKDELQKNGVRTEVITGETIPLERSYYLHQFKNGELQALCNYDILTTGVDLPNVDLIAYMRATESTALYVQTLGRGMRVSPGKTNCLILDYGENILRHGPIDNVRPRNLSKKNTNKEEKERPKAKVCPNCYVIYAIGKRQCPECGYEMPRVISHKVTASTASPMGYGFKKIIKYEVTEVSYLKHEPKNLKKIPSLLVTYQVKQSSHSIVSSIREWWCFEHEGYAKQKAIQRWHNARKVGTSSIPPSSIDEALILASNYLRTPQFLWVQQDAKYDKVISISYY